MPLNEEEHVAHATAVKLLGEKDYFVQVYLIYLNKFLSACEIKRSGANGGFVATGGDRAMSQAVEQTDIYATHAMKPIHNYGKTKK